MLDSNRWVAAPRAWRAAVSIVRRSPRHALAVAWQRARARLALRRCSCVGPGVRVSGRVFARNGGYLAIGARTRIEGTAVRSEFVAFRGGRLEIGSGVYINYGASVSAHERVTIGDGCYIGTYAIIMDNDFHSVEDRFQIPPSKPVVIERNVWLGSRVTVLKGVTIGHDAVIGAGSVVTRSIPPRSLAAGVPARVVRTF